MRLWHWVNAAGDSSFWSMTGYFIATPLPTRRPARRSSHFVMGYIRFAHFSAGQILAVGFLLRDLLGLRRQRACAADFLCAAVERRILVWRRAL